MKRDDSRLSTRHQFDHAVPTVIHDPEEGMPVLARWLHRALQHPALFWGSLIGTVVVVVGLAILVSGWGESRSATSDAWKDLELARTPAAQEDVAQKYPDSPATSWARLQAATGYYNQGFDDLPANRDVALPKLKKALDLFKDIEREAPADSPEARIATLGVARSLEARNEIDKAIAQYDKVAKKWPESPEARQAERLAGLLKNPEAVDFYKQLYAYKPAEVTIPPMGQQSLGLPLGHPSLNGPTVPTPLPFTLPPPPPGTAGGSSGGLPGLGSPLLPSPPLKLDIPASPEKDSDKTKAPKTPAGGDRPELPKDVFAPPAQEKEKGGSGRP